MFEGNDFKKFHRNGYLQIPLKPTKTAIQFKKWIKDLNGENIKKSKIFSASYSETFDLNKCRSDENKLILDFVKDQKFEDQIRFITGHDYFLGDYVFRKTFSKNKSYMSWHRDSYFDKKGDQVGRFPQLLKIIFYPKFEDEVNNESCLKVIPGSHKLVINNNYLDKAIRLFGKKETIYNNNTEMVLFDTILYHHACSTNRENGAFRLILNF